MIKNHSQQGASAYPRGYDHPPLNHLLHYGKSYKLPCGDSPATLYNLRLKKKKDFNE